MALAGDDVGGFIGSPPPDLLTRWFQLGAFNPVFRNHAATDTRPHEAWVDGPQHEALRREAIELRYRLMPYLYTVAEENCAQRPADHAAGVPAVSAGAKASTATTAISCSGRTCSSHRSAMNGLDAHQIVLPPGEWYEFGTSRRHVAQKDPIKLDPRPATTPLYARAGAIVPMQAVVQHTGEKPAGPLQLQVYLPKAGGECSGSLYQDDGESQAYKGGALLRVAYGCEVSKRGVVLTSHVVHDGFAPWWGDVEVTVYGVVRKPSSCVSMARRSRTGRYDAAKQTVVMTLRDARRDWRVQLAY